MIIKWPITTVLVYTLYYRVVQVVLGDKLKPNTKEEVNNVNEVKNNIHHRRRSLKF